MKKWEIARQKGHKHWYRMYLRSHHWRRLRKIKLAKQRWRCETCGYRDRWKDTQRGHRLDVHHKTYRRIGGERLSDLQILCWKCHAKQHPAK